MIYKTSFTEFKNEFNDFITSYWEVKYFFNLNPEGLIINTFKINCVCNEIIFKAYFNLPLDFYKNKTVESISLLLLLMQAYIVKDTEQYGLIKLAEKLVKNDFITAIKTYKLLPYVVNTSEIVSTQQDENTLVIEYDAVGTWIERWHYKQSTRDLKNNVYYKPYEKEARASEKLYYLIYELYNRKCISIHYNIYWLLVELSKYLNKLNSKAFTLDEIYCNKKKYLKSLQYFDDNPQFKKIIVTDLKDFLTVFKQAVDNLSHKIAKADPDFKNQFFKPYINAEKSANSERKKNFKFTPGKNAQRKIPGGKLGHKKRKRYVGKNGILPENL